MPRQLLGTAIAANTITTTQLQTTVVNQISAGGGPRVSSLIYPGNDTAGNTVGGQTVYINGSGFETNNAIYINGNAVPSKSFISASNLSFTTPALSAGIYPVYVINTDTGATAIFVPGYISSGEPTWVTSAGSLNESQDEGTAWSYTLSATGDAPITYALAAGSSLPTGVSLAANGLISGTISSPSGNTTTYTFSVVATDAQNQDSTRQFTVTTATGEGVLFANNVLLIHADGTNNGNNHAFLDSSNNNFTITRNGNATQGSFSPFSQTGWSAYFDGSGDSLTVPLSTNLAFGTGDFTIECWIYFANVSIANQGFYSMIDDTNDAWAGVRFNANSSTLQVVSYNGGALEHTISHQTALQANKWHHCAVTRSGTTMRIFLDGVVGNTTATTSTNYGQSGSTIGSAYPGAAPFTGYISNLRVIKGTAQYTSTFTVPNTPLAPIANTQLLTLQSNRLIDEGPNNFTITRNGDVSIQSFSPFTPGILSSNSHSVYFDGNDTVSYNALTSLSSIAGGPVTIEAWVYYRGNPSTSFEDIFIVGGQGMMINSGKLRFYGLSSTTASTNLTQNTWVHLAVVRESNANLKGYVDGSEVFSTTASANFGGSANATAYIGSWSGSSEYFTGYISNLRVSNSARYTANFTPSTIPFTSDANTALLACQSPTLIDNSNNNFTLTPSGDLRPSKFNPFGQTYTEQAYSTANVGGSIFFDGSGDRLTLPSSNNLVFGTGDFCVETWAYFNANPASMMLFTNIADADTQFAFRVDASGYPKVQGWLTNFAISSATVVANQWYHLVACRVSNTLSIFINGVRTATATVSNNFSSTNAFTIGGPSNDFSGFMSGLRVIKGSSPYNPTRTFISVPTNPVTSIANTQLLLNSTNAQIFDQTAKNVLETVGDAKVSTAQYKYGTGSMYFDGDGDYLVTPGSPILSLGTGDFTVECWLYNLGYSGSQYGRGFFTIYPTAGYTDRLMLRLGNSAETNNRVNMYLAVSGTAKFGVSGTLSTAAITPNTWVHVAFVRQSGAYKLYINGTLDTTISGVTDNISNLDKIEIGRNQDGTVPNFYGYIDDFRYTKGYARYTSNFTPPTSALKDK